MSIFMRCSLALLGTVMTLRAQTQIPKTQFDS